MKHLTYANVMSTIAVLLASTGTAYAAGYIGSAQIIDKSIQGRDVKSQSIGFRHVKFASLDGSHLRSGSIGSYELGSYSVGSSEMQGGAVGSGTIQDMSITCNDLSFSLQTDVGC